MWHQGTWRADVAGRRRASESGTALLGVALVVSIGLVVAGVIVLLGASESRIATAHRDGVEARYAAESALDRALLDLQVIGSWDDVLAGLLTGSLTVGAPSPAAGGTIVDLAAETIRLQAATDARPGHGPNTPRWRPFIWAPLVDLVPVPADLQSAIVVVAWVADDEAEADGSPDNDGNQAVWVHAAAFGPGGTCRRVEALAARSGPAPAPLTRLTWRGRPLGD
jgi:hypothetical protein